MPRHTETVVESIKYIKLRLINLIQSQVRWEDWPSWPFNHLIDQNICSEKNEHHIFLCKNRNEEFLKQQKLLLSKVFWDTDLVKVVTYYYSCWERKNFLLREVFDQKFINLLEATLLTSVAAASPWKGIHWATKYLGSPEQTLQTKQHFVPGYEPRGSYFSGDANFQRYLSKQINKRV